jgi:hypothetical protein
MKKGKKYSVEGVGRISENGFDFYSNNKEEYKATDINCKESDGYTEED